MFLTVLCLLLLFLYVDLPKKESEDQQNVLNVPFQDQATKEKALQNMSSMSSAQIVSTSNIHGNNKGSGLSGLGLPAPVSYPPPVCFLFLYFFFAFYFFAPFLSDRECKYLSVLSFTVLATWPSTWTLSRVC